VTCLNCPVFAISDIPTPFTCNGEYDFEEARIVPEIRRGGNKNCGSEAALGKMHPFRRGNQPDVRKDPEALVF
jgi:hypothetical protein